jgi:2-methylaconitate cis-trans-isomerase PrpF
MSKAIACTIMRGGTSKGILIPVSELPPDPVARDEIILSIFGSPDRRQIDGLGGSDPLTSKVAIIGPPTHTDADIDYLFGQVGIESAFVDYGGYCGNVLAAVASYAVEERFVEASGPTTKVRVHVVNTHRVVIAEVPVANGLPQTEGDYSIFGVPGSGAPIVLNFRDTIGSVTGSPLPTKNPCDRVHVPSIGAVNVSIVDAGNPMIFADLASFGVDVTEGPDILDRRSDLIQAVEAMRIALAKEFEITMPDGSISEHIPLVALVSSPAPYTSFAGDLITPESYDLASREFLCGRIHKAYGVGETVCTSFAAVVPGTVVHSVVAKSQDKDRTVRIGHPSGIIESKVVIANTGAVPEVEGILVSRTARRILDGRVRIHDHLLRTAHGDAVLA